MDNGYMYRARIYELKDLECNVKPADDDIENYLTVSSQDDIEQKFENVRDNENWEKDHYYGPNFQDFIMPTHSRITALSFYDGGIPTITYSQYPDFYEYRVLVLKDG